MQYQADADFAGSLRDSKSTSGGYLMLLGPQTFVPISWLCKKQFAVSHSTTEAETISLDAGLRLEALSMLSLWDIIIDLFTYNRDTDFLRVNKAEGSIIVNGQMAVANRAYLLHPKGWFQTVARLSFFYSHLKTLTRYQRVCRLYWDLRVLSLGQ